VKPWREATRALVLDPANRVLLVKFDFAPFPWVPPGGGVKPTESDEEALRRELWEEAGLSGVELGPCIWTRDHEFPMERWRGQRERIYLVRSDAFEPRPQVDLASEGVTEIRWWTLDEFASADAIFGPRRLPELVRQLLDRGPPSSPIDVGV
jgi:8-oxo-dGTP diphosphatase